jgi:hypothetical protein
LLKLLGMGRGNCQAGTNQSRAGGRKQSLLFSTPCWGWSSVTRNYEIRLPRRSVGFAKRAVFCRLRPAEARPFLREFSGNSLKALAPAGSEQ